MNANRPAEWWLDAMLLPFVPQETPYLDEWQPPTRSDSEPEPFDLCDFGPDEAYCVPENDTNRRI